MILHLLQPARTSYAEGLRIQAEVVAARQANRIGDTLILLEHPPVLTLGRNGSRANILATDAELSRKSVEVYETKRGGDVTYHGPGQLVGYPVFDLRGEWPGNPGPGLRKSYLGPVDFVRLLEEALIFTCKDFGVLTHRICKRTGVWTLPGGNMPEKKIAAIGIHVSRFVTSHGFALNVTTDLRDFEWIVPCGITDRTVTSLEMESPLDPTPTLKQAASSAAANFGRIFNRQMIAVDSLDALVGSTNL